MNKKKNEITLKVTRNRIGPYGCVKGSVTVEASLALFIFLMFFVIMMYFYVIMNLEIQIQAALEQTIDLQSAYCTVTKMDAKPSSDNEADKKEKSGFAEAIETVGNILSSGEDSSSKSGGTGKKLSFLECGINMVFAEGNLIRILGTDYLNSTWIRGGCLGILLIESSFLKDGEHIELVADYRVKIPFFPVSDVKISQRAKRRIWIGNDPNQGESDEEEGEDEEEHQHVYMTPNGSVYHLYEDCSYIKVKLKSVDSFELDTLRNQSGGIYHPCESCKPEKKGTVYITTYGARYHDDQHCKSIEKDAHQVTMEETDGRNVCSKCAKRAGI